GLQPRTGATQSGPSWRALWTSGETGRRWGRAYGIRSRSAAGCSRTAPRSTLTGPQQRPLDNTLSGSAALIRVRRPVALHHGSIGLGGEFLLRVLGPFGSQTSKCSASTATAR